MRYVTVGMAEEQIKRHREWCKSNKCLPGVPCRVCFAKWSQMQYEEVGEKSSDNRQDLIEKLRADNARLFAALKPVLDVYLSQDDLSVEVYDSRMDGIVAINAVREAKRIYKEGSESEVK